MDEQATPAANASASMLGNLLSNPELLNNLGTILGSTSANAKGPSASASADGLAKVLEDPALMAKLPQVMAMLQPMLNASAHTEAPSESQSEPSSSEASDKNAQEVSSEAVPAMASPHAKRSQTDCRDELLLALKPFLSPARCEAVDTIIRLSRLGAVLKHLQ